MKIFFHIIIILLLNIIARLLFNEIFPYWQSILFSFLSIVLFEYFSYIFLIFKNRDSNKRILKYIIFGVLEFIIIVIGSLLISHYFTYKLMGSSSFTHERVIMIRDYSHVFCVLVGISITLLLHNRFTYKKIKRITPTQPPPCKGRSFWLYRH